MVLFEHPDKKEHLAGHSEYMWVSIFFYDKKTDLFLGKLINQPRYLESVGENDNVVFKISDQSQTGLQALGKETGYSVPGWPKQATSKHHKELIRGIKSYRAGAFGHNMPAIEECIRILTPIDQKVPAFFDANDQFTLHFVLGRCYAESYQTVDAVKQFRKCISIKPENFNAHMCLLAEYSVMVHTPKEKLKVGSEQQWEDAFVKQYQLVKQNFPDEDLSMMEIVFNEKMVDDIDSYSIERLEKARKVGFATFRWKKI
jgi:hypothetical protein